MTVQSQSNCSVILSGIDIGRSSIGSLGAVNSPSPPAESVVSFRSEVDPMFSVDQHAFFACAIYNALAKVRSAFSEQFHYSNHDKRISQGLTKCCSKFAGAINSSTVLFAYWRLPRNLKRSAIKGFSA